MSWILAGRGLHFYPAKFVIISVTLVLEVPAVLELSGRNQLMCVMSTLTGKSNSAAAMFDASFLLAMTLSSAILRTNLKIAAFGLLKLCEEEIEERYQNH